RRNCTRPRSPTDDRSTIGIAPAAHAAMAGAAGGAPGRERSDDTGGVPHRRGGGGAPPPPPPPPGGGAVGCPPPPPTGVGPLALDRRPSGAGNANRLGPFAADPAIRTGFIGLVARPISRRRGHPVRGTIPSRDCGLSNRIARAIARASSREKRPSAMNRARAR